MEWVAVVGSVLTLAILIVRYIFSGEAERKRIEAAVKAEEKQRAETSDAAVQRENNQAGSQSTGMGNAWDAADKE